MRCWPQSANEYNWKAVPQRPRIGGRSALVAPNAGRLSSRIAPSSVGRIVFDGWNRMLEGAGVSVNHALLRANQAG